MNNLRMPGFTAGASIYRTSEHYQLARGRAGANIVPASHGVLPQLKSSDLPLASCSKAPVFGNVICAQCTPGPFPKCTNYVCDQSGDNCQAVRLNTQLLTSSLGFRVNRLSAS